MSKYRAAIAIIYLQNLISEVIMKKGMFYMVNSNIITYIKTMLNSRCKTGL